MLILAPLPPQTCEYTVTQSGKDCTAGAAALSNDRTSLESCAVYCCGLSMQYFEYSSVMGWCNCFRNPCTTFTDGLYEYGTISINTPVRE